MQLGETHIVPLNARRLTIVDKKESRFFEEKVVEKKNIIYHRRTLQRVH